MIPKLLKDYKETSSELSTIIELLNQSLSNTTFPLEVRWNTYLEIESSLPIEPYGFNIDCTDHPQELTYYDDLYCDRYQTITFSEIITQLSGKLEEEHLNQLKEEMLNSGYGGCINDW